MIKVKNAKVFGYKLNQVNKFLVALGGAAGVAAAALSDGEISLDDATGIASALVGAFLVFKVKNAK